jgi:hypothetical protein
VAQSSEALDRDHVARIDTKSAYAVKRGDACAKQRCILRRVDVWGNPDCSFGAEGAIFGI